MVVEPFTTVRLAVAEDPATFETRLGVKTARRGTGDDAAAKDAGQAAIGVEDETGRPVQPGSGENPAKKSIVPAANAPSWGLMVAINVTPWFV